MVVILIIIGFPVTVVVSWIYQWTPAGIMTEQDADAAEYTEPIGIGRQIDFVIIVLLIIAVGWLVYDRSIVAPVLENSIAVLPFVNLSSDPEQEYFSDGMSEEILNLLAKTPGLKVIGRTSSFSFLLKARKLLNDQNGREAIVLLNQATELDQNFGEAYELLAYSYWQQGGTSVSMAEAQRLIKYTASRALDTAAAINQ